MHFVPLSDVFYRLAAFHAFHELGNRPEGITTDDVEAVASYRAKRARYNEHLRSGRSTTARRGDGAPTKNWLLSRKATVDPKEPSCTAAVQRFWNMLAGRGTSISAGEMVIDSHITNGRFPSYALDENGLATRLAPQNFKVRPGPFLVRSPWHGNELPVYVLEADVEHFVEHGRLESEDPATTADQPCTTGRPPPGLDVEPRADDATVRDDQLQQAPELSEPTIAAIGRRPASQSQADKIWILFNERRNTLTFKHGELVRISQEIAGAIGYKQNSVEKEIRLKYKELKKKENQGPA